MKSDLPDEPAQEMQISVVPYELMYPLSTLISKSHIEQSFLEQRHTPSYIPGARGE